MSRTRMQAAVLGFALIVLFGGSHANTAEKLDVFVSIVPQVYFVERIGGARVHVQALVPPGSSPATFDPSLRQMSALGRAKIFFTIGVPFEKGVVPKIVETMPQVKVIDTSQGIKLREMKAHHHENEASPQTPSGGHAEHAEDNDHDEEGHDAHDTHDEHGHDAHDAIEEEQDHTGKDPHTWLSPRLVKMQARTIAAALIAQDPAGKAEYEANLAAFEKDLDALDQKLTKALAPVKGKTFMVFHPSWGYFADAYGLNQEPVEVEGKDPGARQLAALIREAKADGVRVIFVQPQFSKASATRVANAIGGVVVPIDPLAKDYIKNLETVATLIAEKLSAQQE